MTPTPERQQYIAWITEAMDQGARQSRACEVIGLTSRTVQRWRNNGKVVADKRPDAIRPAPANKLTDDEKKQIIAVCNQAEHVDLPPSQIVPMLADRGEYIASESSFYRVLNASGQLHHRGRSKPKGHHPKPTSYSAKQANEVWCWDISYLPTRVIGQHYYLYMIEDIYSRKIVGSEVHTSESGEHAADLLQRSVWSEKCIKSGLVLHSDNGAPMKSLTLQAKLYDLGVATSRSRPRVSNDNPYSESLFRTVKYCPRWPSEGFNSLEEARTWVNEFVHWYNHEHRHSRIKFTTPAQRHCGEDHVILAKRRALYKQHKRQNPNRWSGNTRNREPEGDVELNPVKRKDAA